MVLQGSIMQDVMENLSLVVSLMALCLFIFVVVLNLYFIKRNGFYISVNCWFCNGWSKVIYSNRNSFECPTCQQYNGFDKDGGYNRVIKAQHCFGSLSTNKTMKKMELYTNGLCNYCNNNQQLKVQQLANFTPINDNNYDLEVEHFQKQLEKSYKLCKKCEKVVKTSIANKNAWIFGNHLKNLRNKGLSFIDLTKSSDGMKKGVKQSFILKIIRYTLVVFTILILGQVLNVKFDYPTPSIKKIVPRIFGSYQILFQDIFGVCLDTKKQFEEKVNSFNDSYMPMNIKLSTSKLVPITSVGCLLHFVLVICEKKLLWWKINDSLGWMVLLLSSTLTLDSDYFEYINLLQVISSLSLLYSYISHEPKKELKKFRKKYQFLKVNKSVDDSSEEEIEDVHNSCESSDQDLKHTHCQSYPATSLFKCYQNNVHHDQSFATANSNSTASFFNNSHVISSNSLHSDLNISMDNLNLNCVNLIPQPCSSPVFSVSSPRRPVLSPPRLKNITQNPWTAGGFWKNDSQVLSASVHPTNLSRSSSQSSGFVSSNFNSLPASREHSVGGDVERTSVLSEPAYHFLPINADASQLTSQQLYYKTDNNTFYPVLGQNNMLSIRNGVPQQSSFGNGSLKNFGTGARTPLFSPADRPISGLFRNLQGSFSDIHSFRKPHTNLG